MADNSSIAAAASSRRVFFHFFGGFPVNVFICIFARHGKRQETGKRMVAILASGNGSNAQAVVEFFRARGEDPGFVFFSNRKEAGVWQRAQLLSVPIHYITAPDDGARLAAQLEGARIVVLAGYLKKIPPEITQKFFVVNLHPSLLPKFGGKGMYGIHVHRAVLAAGEKTTGITVHKVSDEYDEGQILFQQTLPVPDGATPESLAAAVHALEHQYFPAWIWELYRRHA